MQKLSIRQLRQGLCAVMESVRVKKWSYAVTRYDEQIAVILPLQRYMELVEPCSTASKALAEHKCPKENPPAEADEDRLKTPLEARRGPQPPDPCPGYSPRPEDSE